MIKILLSTYNGEKYLKEQINSLLTQTTNDISIVIRDDGSTDGTKNILKEYEKNDKISVFFEENVGCAASFWRLLTLAGESDYYAFCDQDDVWDNNKLEVALNCLQREDNQIPLLYCSRYRTVDEKLNLIKDYGREGIEIIDYKKPLIYSIAPGCTFVFNFKVRELLIRYDEENLDIHDWIASKIVGIFGKVILDHESHISYRQHGNNTIGAQGGIKKNIRRIKNLFSKNNIRSVEATKIIETYGDIIPNNVKESLLCLSNYSSIRRGKKILWKNFKNVIPNSQRIVFKILLLCRRI